MEFLKCPASYYDNLREHLKTSKVRVAEDLSVVSLNDLLVYSEPEQAITFTLFQAPKAQHPN